MWVEIVKVMLFKGIFSHGPYETLKYIFHMQVEVFFFKPHL
jgi:hypothetical protein